MSRNDLFLLLACAIMAAIMSGNPASLTHASPPIVVSLLSPAGGAGGADPALFQHSFDGQ